MTQTITIFDTTLRDGEQSPGFSMQPEEKLMVAELLDSMGVDVIEAGFAMASEGDFQSVKQIAKQVKNSVICSLARAKKADIERAAEAVKPARRPRIHTFMSTSEIHLKYQFRMEQDEVLELIADTIRYARNFTDDVEWSAMDATRTEHGYLARAVETAINAGATTINLPDTVGYGTPGDIGEMFRKMIATVPNSDKAIFSFHGQNDLGLATANTLAAIEAGARQAELTINGIGERAGNTSLEEVVMTLKTRKDRFPGIECNVDATYLTRASRLIQSITGQSVQSNKAIVGVNAFAHESGIHQDGMLKHSGTYEIMTPESVGLEKTNLVLGKHSGRHAFKDRLKSLGFELGDNALNDAFTKFKTLADKKKEIYDADILAIIGAESSALDSIVLESMELKTGTKEAPSVILALKVDGNTLATETTGSGSLDAIFSAIREIVPHKARLKLYQVHAVTGGIDAQAEVTVRLEAESGELIGGHGVDPDTLVASTKAYIDALNHLLMHEGGKRLNLLDDD